MRATWSICKKELKTFLYSPIAYIMTAFFLVVTGYMFYTITTFINERINMMQAQMQQYGPQPINLNQLIYEPFFSNMAVILMFLLPLLSMRLLADEKRQKTEEMLLTSPLPIPALVIGKFLAALIVFSGILALTATYTLILASSGTPEIAPLMTAYLGIWLMGAAFIAIGTFASSLTENQVIAAVIAFSSILLIWIVSWLGQSAGPTWSAVLTYFSFITHFQNLAKGVLDSQDIIYYLSFIFTGLFLSWSVFEFRKWR